MRVRVVAVGIAVAACALSACTSSRNGAAPGSTQSVPQSVQSSATAASSASGSGSGGTDWPMYHGTADHAGLAPNMPTVSHVAVERRLNVDGAVYASPLVIAGMTITATENDTMYAFDQSGKQLWRQHLGSPSPANERQCGDISPLGITGTPIYDHSSGLVYVVAELGGNVRHELFALRAKDGGVAWSRSVDLPGVSARDMQQRGALTITAGKVWVPYGAQAGDCGDYKGRIVGESLDGSGQPVFYSPPTVRGGGMWNPAGATVDANGHLLVVSANGAAFPGSNYDHTNSVLELDASANLLDSFAPTDWAENNRDDVGLGSQGVALVGDKWAVLGGKSGPVYVLRRGHLGGVGGQVDVKDVCKSFGGAAVDGSVVYLPCTDGVRAVQVSDAGQLSVLWHADESITGTPTVGGGRVWALDSGGGVLHALDPRTGKSLEQVDVGEANRFAAPAISGSRVFVPTLSGLAVVSTS
jgi:outer membrane protein assembly factor BamB